MDFRSSKINLMITKYVRQKMSNNLNRNTIFFRIDQISMQL